NGVERNLKFVQEEGCKVYLIPNLHSKIYCNESKALITSLNLILFSILNNKEIGILLNKELEPEEFNKIISYVKEFTKSDIIKKDIEISTKKDKVYVLRLENDKWYIGETDNLSLELEKHKSRKKNSWTNLYRFIALEEIREDIDLRKVTIEYMKKYGWWNVRGYNFSSQEGEKWPPEEILDQFQYYEEDLNVNPVIYVLKLQNEKWFVGKTRNLKQKLEDHKKGTPPWVDIHKMVGVEEVIEDDDLKTVVLDYMKRYEWENVRGYAWSQWDMKRPPKELR
ncbi:unnamed protein product, partial [marine sediment metagenome]